MNICHVISSIDKFDGGTSSFIQTTLGEIAQHISVSLLTIKSNNPVHIDKKVRVIFAQKSFPYLNLYSKKLKFNLENLDCNLFHGNGLWQFPVNFMAQIAKKRGVPYLISPHGMLEPWAMRRGAVKKNLALLLYQRNSLENAACLHALTLEEFKNIKKLNLKNPIAIIPNGIDLKKFKPKDKSDIKNSNTILFLSRLHPKKGIELLIEAWAKIPQNIKRDWVLRIVGGGEAAYVNKIHKIISEKSLINQIELVGSKFDNYKITEFQNSDLFVLPSYSEGFPIAVLEALACGIPVITTKGTSWQELQTHNAGWWIDIGVEPLIEALTEAMKLSDNERIEMGLNGRKLVEENYSIELVAQKMIQLYEWILFKTKKPEFIID